MTAQRHLTMSALGAAIAIRRYLQNHPDASADAAALAIRRSDADFMSSDFESALELHEILPIHLVFETYHDNLRECLEFLLLKHRPWWIQAIPYGRERVASAIGEGSDEGRDELQSLRAAGLYTDPVTEEAVQWWDRLARAVRSDIDDRLLLQGRAAERLSLEYERARLKSLGILKVPHWKSIEDNGAGFDIHSYDVGAVEPISRLIEVKSSTRTPVRIILSKNEWAAALRYGDSYVFHIWELPAQRLVEKTVKEIASHIPVDQGEGTWLNVEIEI